MQVDRIEQWVGRTVLDTDGQSVGKLEEVYFRGEEPVLAEVKPGLLARKRYLVPLVGASFSRDDLRLDFREDHLLHESSGGKGFDAEDLTAVADHYGAACSYQLDELESSSRRIDRLAARAQARERAEALEAEAEQRRLGADAARERASAAQQESAAADEAYEAAKERAEHARAALDSRVTPL